MDSVSKSKIKTFGVSFPADLLEKLDFIRKDVPRSKYVQRLVERNQEEVLKT